MAVSKKDAALKKREKFRAMGVGNGFSSNEPIINPEKYNESLMKALNHYNVSNDNKEKRKWFNDYIGKKESIKFNAISNDSEFRSAGTIARLKTREQYLDERELNFLESEIKRLTALIPTIKVEKKDTTTDKPIITIQDRIAEAANTHIAEFNAMIDEFITLDTQPNFSSYLEANNVSAPVAKLIPNGFVNFWNELQDLIEGTDKQLVEGYSNIKKVKVKKICKLIEEIEAACAQRAVAAKVARKPRARKEKPPAVLAAKVKFMKEFEELSLKSERPDKIVGAKEVLVYNTKYKKVQVYRAFGDGTLSVKGTTIVNYDVATSGSKTLRKPEVTKDFVDMTRRNFAAAFKALTTKESAVNGRLNEECIILKVF